MPRRINQVERIPLPAGGIVESRRGSLNGNTTLPFQFHQIQHLGAHFACGESVSVL